MYGTRAWTSFYFCRNLLHQIMWKQNPSGFGGEKGELFVFKMCLMYVLLCSCFLSPKCFHHGLESRDLCIWILKHHTVLWHAQSLGDTHPILLQRRKNIFPTILDSVPWSLQIKLTKDELTRKKVYSFYLYLFAGWVHKKALKLKEMVRIGSLSIILTKEKGLRNDKSRSS